MAVRCMGSAERLIILIECLPIISSLASLSYDLLARSLVAIADTHNYVRCAAAVAASVLFGHVLSLSLLIPFRTHHQLNVFVDLITPSVCNLTMAKAKRGVKLCMTILFTRALCWKWNLSNVMLKKIRFCKLCFSTCKRKMKIFTYTWFLQIMLLNIKRGVVFLNFEWHTIHTGQLRLFNLVCGE